MRHPITLVVTLVVPLLLLAACSNATAPRQQPPATCTFANPLGPGADPWVVRQGSAYYLAQAQDRSIKVYKSTTLSDITSAPGVVVWTAPDTGWNRTNIWAPELH